MKIRSVLATTSLVATGGLVAFAAPASADLVTRCSGEGGAVTVPGDLVVAAGDACYLTGTTIEGNVTVRQGADLVVVDGSIKGSVRVGADAYFDTTNSSVSGLIRTTNAYGTYLDTSTVAGVKASAESQVAFTYSFGSEIGGAVRATGGELLISGSDVSGAVTGAGTTYTDVYDSVLMRTLTVSGNELGGVFCESEIDGDASYTGNSDALQIGADGPISVCEGPSYFGGDLEISDNTAEIVVSNNIIRGNLSGDGNDPAPTGENNRVRGEMTGQFADLAAPMRTMARMSVEQSNVDRLDAKVEERRAEAKAEADAVGKAQL